MGDSLWIVAKDSEEYCTLSMQLITPEKYKFRFKDSFESYSQKICVTLVNEGENQSLSCISLSALIHILLYSQLPVILMTFLHIADTFLEPHFLHFCYILPLF
jgi:hypothetical protein